MLSASARLVSRHRISIIVIFAVLTALAAFPLSRLAVDADFLSILDQDEQSVRNFEYAEENFESSEAMVLLFKAGPAKAELITEAVSRLKKLDSVVGASVFRPPKAPADSPATIVLLKPDFKPTEIDKTSRLDKQIDSTLKDMGLDASVTGSYQVLKESSDSVNRDMLRASALTFAGLAILMIPVLRLRIWPAVTILLTLLVSLCFTLALTELLLGKLNLLTAAIPAVIMGLGIDFMLHILYAFNEKACGLTEYTSKHELNERMIVHTYRKTLLPMAVGAVTTSGAFLSLTLAGSKGLVDMGIMGAVGIFSNFICAVVLFPAMLSFASHSKIENIRRTDRIWTRVTAFLGPGPASTIILSGTIAAVAIACFFAAGVKFDSDQSKLSDQNLPSYRLQERLANEFGFSPVPVMIISPDEQTEQQKLALLAHNQDTFGFVQSYSTALKLNMSPDRFVGKDGSLITLAYPEGNSFKPENFQKLKSVASDIKAVFPGPESMVTGSAFINSQLNSAVRSDLARCTLAAAAVILTIISASFKSAKLTALAVVPVTLGILLTIGLMGILGIDFNIMTIVVVPLIIGTGIDDGVHLAYRWLHEKGSTASAVSAVANPIIATTLTSMLAFASLTIAANPGFRQLGLVTSAGLLLCLLITLIVLPAILKRTDCNTKTAKPNGST